jgi:integrase
VRLTDQTIRGLPFTESGQCEYTDNAVRGLALRVGTRTKTFVLLSRKGGTRKRHTLGQYDPPHFTLAIAREKAKDLLAADRLSKAEAPRTTFEEALQTYHRDHVSRLRKTSQRAIRQTIDRQFKPKRGKKFLSDIRPTHIAPLVDVLIDRPTEMHNGFVYLSMFLNWCMRRGYIETSPTARMETPPKPPSRERVLSPAELTAVWRAADPETDYGRIVRLSVLSGQRIGQWAAIRREYIGSGTITWPADAMKGKRSHELPLTSAMRELLPDRAGLLFATENVLPFSNWSRAKHRLDKANGLSGYTHHDLRRTWATICAEQLNIEPHIIESVLAHTFGTPVARTYNRAKYLAPMRSALLAFEEWLQKELSKPEDDNGRQLGPRRHGSLQNEAA